ncbi:DNA pilot protein [Microviridae sp.]|nr:DNA pilot protein [Microviridae sp.]
MGLFSTIGTALGVGAGDVFGGVLGGLGGLAKQRADKASSARQMAFQERMSNTAHQRQMKDLKKAGINPMLSAKLGGASSPSGSQYQATNIGAEAVKGGLAGAQTATAKQQALIAKSNADIAHVEAQVAKTFGIPVSMLPDYMKSAIALKNAGKLGIEFAKEIGHSAKEQAAISKRNKMQWDPMYSKIDFDADIRREMAGEKYKRKVK